MTNEEILNLYEGLCEISQNKDLKFKATTSFLLAKNKNLITPFYEAIIETRDKLIEKYGEQKEDGILIPNEKLAQFKSELNAFLKTTTYIDVESIPLTAFEEEKIGIDLMGKLIFIIKK